MIPAAGIVRTHAQTMRPATPHRTADKRFVAPTPTIEPVIVCVVLTGNAELRRHQDRDRAAGLRAEPADRPQLRDARSPSCARCASRRTACRARSPCTRRSRPSTGSRRHVGDVQVPSSPVWPREERLCVATSRPTMMPIVFCASFAPCEKRKQRGARRAARRGTTRSTRAGAHPPEDPVARHHQREARRASRSAATATMNSSVLIHLAPQSDRAPARPSPPRPRHSRR